MQTKRQSLIETCSNTCIGMIGSWLITLMCISNFNDPLDATTITVILCTIWSLVRGYFVRRAFNKVTP